MKPGTFTTTSSETILILELLLRTEARKKKKRKRKITEILKVSLTSVMAVPAVVVLDFRKTGLDANNKDISIIMNKEDMGLRNNTGEQLVKVYGEVMILGGKTSKEKIFNLPYNLNSRFL
jgi:hypothetical protein